MATAVVLTVGLTLLGGCEFGRVIRHGFPSIEDGERFEKRILTPSETPYHFPTKMTNRQFKLRKGRKMLPMDEFLEETNSTALLILHCDTLIYERYLDGYTDSSLVNGFSLAKSFTGSLVGCAIEDGYIDSVEQQVIDFIPELNRGRFPELTIRHLLQMRTGLSHPEAKLYYHENLEEAVMGLELKRDPDKKWVYWSVNSQLLGLVLQRALKDKPLTTYLQEKIWSPLGMESVAWWNTDDQTGEAQLEKTFCCINATARDFAKLGQLYLHGGYANGQRILPADYAYQATHRDTVNKTWPYYGYHWWLLPGKQGEFMGRGFLGQYIYVNPTVDVVIVRLGHNRGGQGFRGWERIFGALARKLDKDPKK